MGVKMSFASSFSILSTQVAPRLHQAHQREGQFNTLLISHLGQQKYASRLSSQRPNQKRRSCPQTMTLRQQQYLQIAGI